MKILGISAFYHDSAAALIEDGRIVAAAQEERFSRKKHDERFPINAVRFCLDFGGLTLKDLDAIAFYDKPLLKFERLLETYYDFAPRGIRSFMMSMGVWLKDKLFLKRLIRDEFKKIDDFDVRNTKLLFPEHHLSHAASAFYPSPFQDAAVLTIDGVGEWATASILKGSGSQLTNLKELHFPDSVGLLYSAFTYFLGFKVNSGEYKLMGLAPYGNRGSDRVREYEAIILRELVQIFPDGSIRLNQKYFDFATGLRMVHDPLWEKLFGFPKRQAESELTQEQCDLGLAIQNVTEDIVIKMALEAKRLTGSENLCLAGGVALNCVANGKLHREKIFQKLFIQPAAGDAGGALGAALAAYHIYFQKPREPAIGMDAMKGSYLGPEFSDLQTRQSLRKFKAVGEWCESTEALCKKTASWIAEGNVIGWFQDRMEWGPRSLGNRSIIADARSKEMQLKLNLKIKYRESFRPFAPSVLAEDCGEYFELDEASPYMLLVADVKAERRKKLPDRYESLPLREKLYFLRSDIPSVTHVDYSARVQTVHRETNEKYWLLLRAFKELTGYGLLVNTSFNVRGEPIVCTPEDAYKCLMRSEMDYLIVNNMIYDKKKQPAWQEKTDWKTEYGLD